MLNKPRQQAILNFIRDYPHQNTPTVREIREGVGFKSSSSVRYHLTKLVNQGIIERWDNCPRCIALIKNSYRKLGDIVGLPEIAICNIADAEQQMAAPTFIMNDALKKNNLGELQCEIERLRERMEVTVLDKGISHPDVVSISHSIDKVINEFLKFDRSKKAVNENRL